MSGTTIEHRVESRIGRMNVFVAPDGAIDISRAIAERRAEE